MVQPTTKEQMYQSMSGTFKLITTFVNVPILEVKQMITDYSKVKKLEELGNKVIITWSSDIEWPSQPLEYLGYQVFPRREHLGQTPTPTSYTLGE